MSSSNEISASTQEKSVWLVKKFDKNAAKTLKANENWGFNKLSQSNNQKFDSSY